MVCMCVRGRSGGWSFLCRQSSTDPLLPVAHFTNVSMHCRPGRHDTSNPHRFDNFQSGNESAASAGLAWERLSRFSRPASYTQLLMPVVPSPPSWKCNPAPVPDTSHAKGKASTAQQTCLGSLLGLELN